VAEECELLFDAPVHGKVSSTLFALVASLRLSSSEDLLGTLEFSVGQAEAGRIEILLICSSLAGVEIIQKDENSSNELIGRTMMKVNERWMNQARKYSVTEWMTCPARKVLRYRIKK
jgi:hypothetical protein